MQKWVYWQSSWSFLGIWSVSSTWPFGLMLGCPLMTMDLYTLNSFLTILPFILMLRRILTLRSHHCWEQSWISPRWLTPTMATTMLLRDQFWEFFSILAIPLLLLSAKRQSLVQSSTYGAEFCLHGQLQRRSCRYVISYGLLVWRFLIRHDYLATIWVDYSILLSRIASWRKSTYALRIIFYGRILHAGCCRSFTFRRAKTTVFFYESIGSSSPCVSYWWLTVPCSSEQAVAIPYKWLIVVNECQSLGSKRRSAGHRLPVQSLWACPVVDCRSLWLMSLPWRFSGRDFFVTSFLSSSRVIY